MTTRHNKTVIQNRVILSKIIDCIKFCRKYELSLRGYDESSASSNAGVFCRLLDFLSDYDPVFKSHLKSNSVFKGISKTIQNDILDSILIMCKQIIETEINNSDFLAVIMDETTNVSDKSQVVLVFRYIKNGKAVERFWEFFNPADLTAATLSGIVANELKLLIGSFLE